MVAMPNSSAPSRTWSARVAASGAAASSARRPPRRRGRSVRWCRRAGGHALLDVGRRSALRGVTTTSPEAIASRMAMPNSSLRLARRTPRCCAEPGRPSRTAPATWRPQRSGGDGRSRPRSAASALATEAQIRVSCSASSASGVQITSDESRLQACRLRDRTPTPPRGWPCPSPCSRPTVIARGCRRSGKGREQRVQLGECVGRGAGRRRPGGVRHSRAARSAARGRCPRGRPWRPVTRVRVEVEELAQVRSSRGGEATRWAARSARSRRSRPEDEVLRVVRAPKEARVRVPAASVRR